MGYVVVVAAALAVGVAVYVVTLRRSTASDTRSFDYPGSEVSGGPRRSTGVTYVPVAAGSPVSWRSRSIGLAGLVALVLVCAVTIAVTLYKVGSVLIRVIIHKLQSS